MSLRYTVYVYNDACKLKKKYFVAQTNILHILGEPTNKLLKNFELSLRINFYKIPAVLLAGGCCHWILLRIRDKTETNVQMPVYILIIALWARCWNKLSTFITYIKMYNKNFQKYYWVNPINFTNNLICAAKKNSCCLSLISLNWYFMSLCLNQNKNKKQKTKRCLYSDLTQLFLTQEEYYTEC